MEGGGDIGNRSPFIFRNKVSTWAALPESLPRVGTIGNDKEDRRNRRKDCWHELELL
jgi:hypothetical protein